MTNSQGWAWLKTGLKVYSGLPQATGTKVFIPSAALPATKVEAGLDTATIYEC